MITYSTLIEINYSNLVILENIRFLFSFFFPSIQSIIFPLFVHLPINFIFFRVSFIKSLYLFGLCDFFLNKYELI